MINKHIEIQTVHYKGPLNLLLYLIKKQEVDINDLELTEVTEQYLEYLSLFEEYDFDIAGDYLFMATTLVYLKSLQLFQENLIDQLVEEPEHIEIRSTEELIKKLQNLQHFQKLGQKLESLPLHGKDTFGATKNSKRNLIQSDFTQHLEINSLAMAYLDIMKKNKNTTQVIDKEKVGIKEKIIQLKNIFNDLKKMTFHQVLKKKGLPNINLKGDRILTFLSLLELSKLKFVELFQSDDIGEIYIHVKEQLNKLNVSLLEENITSLHT